MCVRPRNVTPAAMASSSAPPLSQTYGKPPASTLAQAPKRAWRYILDINERAIANVGLAVWLCLLAMNTPKHHMLGVAAGSTLLFRVLNSKLSPVLTQFAPKRKGSFDHFLNACITIVHALLMSAMSIFCVYSEYGTTFQDLRVGSSPLSKTCVTIAVGYFAYDLWHIVHTGMVRQTPALMVHHLAIMVIYSIVIVESQYYPYMVLTLLCEPHTVMMQARKVAKVALDVPRGIVDNKVQSAIYWGIWALNFTTCAAVRLAVHGWILLSVVQARNSTDLFPETWMWNCACGGMVMINVINIGLAANLFAAYKKDLKLVKKFRDTMRNM